MTHSSSDHNPTTKQYRSESCHETGYRWIIDAPKQLDPAEVRRLQAALVEWTDDPHQLDVSALLDDQLVCADFGLVNIDLLRSVRIDVHAVHQERFAQNFEPAEPVPSLFD